ncbi:unnamed protein product [Lactuca virosa]|uniref:Uncharacterized protein n=1 Tax=Lactuca virosa TaxID=75947 RepID=A0AAU9LLV9_9ASTR|nr:unnamed protein product [Lactuca virosa]
MPASSNRKIDPTLFVRLLPDQFIESDDTIFNRSHLSLIDFLKSITYACVLASQLEIEQVSLFLFPTPVRSGPCVELVDDTEGLMKVEVRKGERDSGVLMVAIKRRVKGFRLV